MFILVLLNFAHQKKQYGFNQKKLWMPVDQYIGIRTRKLHLLYSRFLCISFHNKKFNLTEPFDGLLLKEWFVMRHIRTSGNWISPDIVMEKYLKNKKKNFNWSI